MTESTWPDTGPSTKFFMIVGLFLASLIPGIFISGLINERELRQSELIPDFTASWGPQQTVGGPILVIPYLTPVTGTRGYLKVGSEKLEATAELTTEDRRRGLFHASVYDAAIQMRGSIRIPSPARLTALLSDKSTILWEESFVAIPLTSRAGMKQGDRLIWNGQETSFVDCRDLAADEDCRATSQLVARARGTALRPDMEVPFQVILDFRGTSTFWLTASARQFDALISAPWPTPSFSGSVLPVSSQIGKKGFAAHWQSFQSDTQSWITPHLVDSNNQTMAKIELLEPVPVYRMIYRASKYTPLFIALAFAAYVLFELLSGIRIHLLQYGLMALSLCLFSLLLLSLAEPFGYDWGFLLGSLMVIAQASLYTWSVTRGGREAGLFAALLTTLFGFLYVLLSLETYSLLVGSLALFLVLSSLMALTSRIKWGSR